MHLPVVAEWLTAGLGWSVSLVLCSAVGNDRLNYREYPGLPEFSLVQLAERLGCNPCRWAGGWVQPPAWLSAVDAGLLWMWSWGGIISGRDAWEIRLYLLWTCLWVGLTIPKPQVGDTQGCGLAGAGHLVWLYGNHFGGVPDFLFAIIQYRWILLDF